MVNKQILNYIKTRVPHDLLLKLDEELHAVYAEAHVIAKENIRALNEAHLRGLLVIERKSGESDEI